MAWWNKIGWWRWLVSGLLLGAGFVHPWLWLLGLVGAGMFIKLSRDSGSRKRVLVYAWLAWSVKAGLAILWLWSTYPIAWLPSELGQIQLVLIGFYWLSSACSLGLGGVVAFWLIRQVKRFFFSQAAAGRCCPAFWVGCGGTGRVTGLFCHYVWSRGCDHPCA
jgi:hypothetical protein